MEFRINSNKVAKLSVTMLSIIGSLSSIYFVFKDQAATAAVLMITISMIVLVIFLVHLKSYIIYERYYSTKSDLLSLTNRLRNDIENITNSDNSLELDQTFKSSLNTILNHSARVFSRLTGQKCTSSIMIPENEQNFKTKAYSDNVDCNRENKPSNPINVDEGYVGEAIKTMRTATWSLDKSEDKTFAVIREDHRKHYLSGMVCPVFVGHGVYAIFNVDSKQPNVFHEREEEFGMAFANLVGLIFSISDIVEYNMEEEQIYYHKIQELHESLTNLLRVAPEDGCTPLKEGIKQICTAISE